MNAAMSPVRYASDPDRFRALQTQLNSVLVLYGYKIDDQGRFARARKRATTLDEAAELAGALHTELRRRGCHDALLLYCREAVAAPLALPRDERGLEVHPRPATSAHHVRAGRRRPVRRASPGLAAERRRGCR